MAVVPISQQALIKSKAQLQQALKQRDWQRVKEIEQQLNRHLLAATQDRHRDTLTLVNELKDILNLYALLTQTCRDQVTAIAADSGWRQG